MHRFDDLGFRDRYGFHRFDFLPSELFLGDCLFDFLVHVALDVRALLANFHVDGTPARPGRRLQLGERTALQRDAVVCLVPLAVGDTQMHEQYVLVFVRNQLACLLVGKSGFLHLLQQVFHGDIDRFSEFFNSYFSHQIPLLPRLCTGFSQPWPLMPSIRTTVRAPS